MRTKVTIFAYIIVHIISVQINTKICALLHNLFDFVFLKGTKRKNVVDRKNYSSSFLNRLSSSQQVYSSVTPSSSCIFNTSPSESTASINKLITCEKDYKGTTNRVKNAILRRTDEMDDALSLPMSGSTVSLIADPSKLNYSMYPNSSMSSRMTSNKEGDEEEMGYKPQLSKDVSPSQLTSNTISAR